MSIVGVVIAGGRARRFGADKALAELDGRPLIAHVADALAPACSRLAINCASSSRAAAWAISRGLPVLPDPLGSPDSPLAGVLAALDWAVAAGADMVATAPCDTPVLPLAMPHTHCAALSPAAPAAFAATAQGPEPLCALWRASARDIVKARLAAGRLSVMGALGALGAVPVRFEAAHAFANVNTESDLARLMGRGHGSNLKTTMTNCRPSS
jgi:molybdopterin-guanine dinucleotide biosynthesis protein A